MLRLLLPVALIALCLMLTDARATLARLSGLSAGWFIITLALLNAVTVLSALRWRMTAAALDLQLPPGLAVQEYYLAQLANQTLPGGVLGDASRALRNRHGGPLRRAAQAVVLERAAGQAGMAAVALGGAGAMLMTKGAPADLPGIIWLPAGFLALLLIGGAAVALLGASGGEGGWRLAAHTALIRHLPTQAALSLVIAALTVAAFATSAAATGSPLAPVAAAFLVPLVLTAMLLPASIAGWGWREGAAAALFPLAGLTAEAGIAASIAFGIAGLISALPGAFFLRRVPRVEPQ
nr:lysylphosphatidylglycerol synthase transmembrane domain-containing protein [Frigidibacter albus]